LKKTRAFLEDLAQSSFVLEKFRQIDEVFPTRFSQLAASMSTISWRETDNRPRMNLSTKALGTGAGAFLMKMITIRVIGLLAVGFWLQSEASAQNYVPTTFTGTGPYERVYANTGYSYMAANVFLPGSSQISMASGDTGYVYAGGWGNLAGAGALDAGFQYSTRYNDWALFESGAGYGQTAPTNGDRFLASETVSLSFAVVSSGTAGSVNLVVTATGMDGGNSGNGYVGNGMTITESVSLLVSSANEGWSAGSGNQDTLKRMTTIAQSSQNFTDGSYIDGVVWSNVVLGQSAADATTWSGGGSQSYPNTPGVVSVNYVNSASETDSINLSPNVVPEPSSWVMLATGLASGLVYLWRQRRTRRLVVALAT
jgi:hypothetical protein